MKYLFSVFIVFGMFISGINFGFSANFDCCYTGSDVIPKSKGGCVGEDTILLSDVTSLIACNELGTKKLSCETASGTFCQVSGNIIFDNQNIKNKFASSCSNFVTYDQTTCISGSTDPGVGDDDGTGGSDDGSDNGDDIDDTNDEYDDELINYLTEQCRDGGGFLGLYVNQNSCESVDLAGENKCVFNPYLGGNFNSYFQKASELGILDIEKESCIVDRALKVCSDLKSESLCNGDKVDSLTGNCRWVSADQYVENLKVDGMCVSKEISNEKYFNEKNYYYSKNVIKNPSFEFGSLSKWSGNAQLGTDKSLAYFGDFYAKLNSNTKLSQTVRDLTDNYFYMLTFNFRNARNDSTGNLKVLIGGVEQLSLPMTSLNSKTYGVYTTYDDVIFKPTSSDIKVEFSYEGDGEIHIDAVGLKVFDSKSPIIDSSKLFTPVDIRPKSASNCNLCFTDGGFNLCSQKKSDLLGDCSYMVSSPKLPYGSDIDLSKYLGNVKNLYLSDLAWESQSLYNSELFCELYTSKTMCENSSNFVNSEYGLYHLESSGNLCKWKSGVGCFKDSNGDNQFDIIENYPKVEGTPHQDFQYGIDAFYLRSNPSSSALADGVQVSDFEISCDILPPNVYVSLTGRNDDLESVFIGLNDDGEIIGDVYLELLASDSILSSCDNFEFDSVLYIEYMLNNADTFIEKISSNQHNIIPIKIDDYLVDNLGDSLIDSSTNNLKIKVTDQSGNVGKIWDFDLNIDNSGPKIELMSPSFSGSGDTIFLTTTLVNLDSFFDFRFSDKTKVESCKYNLEGIDGADSTHYTHFGNFTFPSSNEVLYDFDLPIFNSSSNGDGYLLSLECSDIFNQSSNLNIFFTIDIHTQLVLVTPESFKYKENFVGFLNQTADVILTSSDSRLTSCGLENYVNLDSSLSSFSIVDYDSAVHDELLGNSVHSEIKKVIFGQIGFSSDDEYLGNYYCEDNLGNKFTEEHTYYYDTQSPVLLDYNILKDESEMFVDGSGKIYIRSNGQNSYNLDVNLSVDGTGSWIVEDGSLSLIVGDGSTRTTFPIDNVNFFDSVLQNHTFDSTMFMRANIDSSLIVGKDVSGQTGLKELNFEVGLIDKAGNRGVGELSYYYDVSKPSFNFSGDLIDIDNTDDLIFTKEMNPNVEVLFSAPEYRQFECSVELTRGNQKTPISSYSSGSSFNFRMSDLDVKEWFKNYGEVSIKFSCVDIFGESLVRQFNLIYDNTPLILNSISLNGGNEIFSRIATNYQPLVDGIDFEFNNTDEIGGYYCSYKFVELDNMYNCFDNFTKLNKFNRLSYTSSPASNILSGLDLSVEDSNLNYFCSRSSVFGSYESLNFNSDSDLKTKFGLEVNCMDGSGFEVSKSIEINYTYLSGGLISFDYEYLGLDSVKFIVRSIVEYSEIKVAFDSEGVNSLVSMSGARSEDGVFVYESLGYLVDDLIEGEFNLFAVAFDYGFSDGFIEKNFFIDKTLPVGNLTIVDLNNQGNVFDDIFKFDLSMYDEVSGLSKVELFVNNNLVAKFNGSDYEIMTYDNYSIILSDFSIPSFTDSGKNFTSSIIFGVANLNEQYDIKLVGTDGVGRQLVVEDSVTYVEGIYFDILDSENSAVYDKGFGWITKESAPILKFETSKVVTCRLKSSKGGFIFSDGPKTEFEFDLSTIENFDLVELGDEVDFKIDCSTDSSTYSFTKSLLLNDKLLDYVLVPEFGFLVNEDPYVFGATIYSVGPFSKISCSYDLGGKLVSGIELDGGKADIVINFTDFPTGKVNFNLNCIDAIGNFGPVKNYVFDVVVDGPLFVDVDSLVLASSNFESKLDELDNLYIHSLSNNVLKFNLNKKNVEICEFGIDPVGGILSRPINFFRSLFGIERYDMISSSPYAYIATGLEFKEGVSELEILCVDSDGSRFSETYNVNYVDNNLDLSTQRVEN